MSGPPPEDPDGNGILMAPTDVNNLEPWVAELSHLATTAERLAWLERNPRMRSKEAVETLYNAVVLLGRVDLKRAENIAEVSAALAAGTGGLDGIPQKERASRPNFFTSGPPPGRTPP